MTHIDRWIEQQARERRSAARKPLFGLLKLALCIIAVPLAIGILTRGWGPTTPVPEPVATQPAQPQPSAQPAQPQPGAVPGLLPEITTFLAEHREFGQPTSVQAMPNWAKGQRQRVNFDSGHSLLFYLKDGAVMTVYEGNNRDNKVWGQYDQAQLEPKNATVSAGPDEDEGAQPATDAADTPEDQTTTERAKLINKRKAKRARAAGRP